MQNTESTLQLRLWTVEEYHRMAEAGILHEDPKKAQVADSTANLEA
ncbi:hypothetical protein SAMD00079811_68570 [Scytonema sp. HK-05]|nr:hypothetical protein SAMD00079811_68570 [Scytonema sp. HK-05]